MRALRRFAGAENGGVAIIMAISFLPLLLMAGAAVDLRRISAAKSNLQQTADSAALAAVDALRQHGNYDEVARSHVAAAFEGSGLRPTSVAEKLNDTTVRVTINLKVPMTIMQLARINEASINAEAMAAYGAAVGETIAPAAEVILALDTTGSMSLNGRLDAAKDAAKSLIEKVMKRPDGTPDPNVKVGLVPFAQYVNVGTQYRNQSWLKDTQDWSAPGGQSCGTTYTYDPGPPKRVEKTCWKPDETFEDCSYDEPTWINPRDPVQTCTTLPPITHTWHGCVGSDNGQYWDSNWGKPLMIYYDEVVELFGGRPFGDTKAWGILDVECANPLVRLTTNRLDLDSAIGALEPRGLTYIAPAVLWGWRLLTRGQPFNDAKPSGEAIKSLVLMTDGANTRAKRPSYTNHESTDIAAANDKTLKVCANAKAAGIKIYTIGFMAPDSIKPILRTCASIPTYYYDAPSIPELQRAYDDIASKMTALRLIK